MEFQSRIDRNVDFGKVRCCEANSKIMLRNEGRKHFFANKCQNQLKNQTKAEKRASELEKNGNCNEVEGDF